MKQVCVVGAGVIGLSVATHLLESYHNELVVTVIADRFTPDTTASDRSGGLILVSAQQDSKTTAVWMKNSLEHFSKLYNVGKDATDKGISRSSGVFVKPQDKKGPAWYKDMFPSNYQDLCSANGQELAQCSTYLVSPSKYLSYLMNKIQQLGGVLVKHKVESVSELSSFDVIVNCTGLRARDLASDINVYPIKGTVVSIKAPWIKEWLLEGVVHSPRRTYCLPRTDDVILGGFNENGVADSLIDLQETQGIIDRCVESIPSIRKAEVLQVWTGIRPMRKGGVRLEKELINDTVVIHNYGHGSYGMTLSWGCAEEVGDIVGQTLGIVKKPIVLSKL